MVSNKLLLCITNSLPYKFTTWSGEAKIEKSIFHLHIFYAMQKGYKCMKKKRKRSGGIKELVTLLDAIPYTEKTLRCTQTSHDHDNQ